MARNPNEAVPVGTGDVAPSPERPLIRAVAAMLLAVADQRRRERQVLAEQTPRDGADVSRKRD